MTDYDRKNLKFLLSCDPATLLDWYNTVDEEDHEYASELLTQYSEELKLREKFSLVEAVNLDNLVPDAQQYLKKFSIKK